jgi:hypothetical protein
MRYLNRLIWAAVFACAFSTSAFAQQGTIVTGAGGGATGSISGTGGLAGGGIGGLGGSMGGNSLSGNLGNTSNGGSIGQDQSQNLSSASGITAPGAANGGRSGSSTISASNWLGATMGNPYYQGIPSNAKSNVGPGGFGSALYPASGGTGGGSIGYAGGSIAGGRGGALGGRGGRGGSTSDPGGVLIQLPVQIAYPAIAQFPAAPIAAPQMQTELAGMLARSNAIANPAGVQVITDGANVILRGTVKNLEEARTVAGLVRLTPGVHSVKNELTFPKP